ncbi:type II toxin-antitoxin system VapC family toxin [Sphingomonas melonis]|uniref:PIN domain-containing protein n=1 Tax=Sphingomonas melonis TaxID=152682 RepID=A0A7Y9FP67_9SPHN|nr:hypothetical protein [Sphingomonas melonis]
MILLDTNIIIDLLNSVDGADESWSRRNYNVVGQVAALACNHVILSEVAAGTARLEFLIDDLEALNIEILPLTADAAIAAGLAFAVYRRRGGTRQAILADFLIAGHAQVLGATLMTRDRRLATYFPDLTLITPETHP